MLAELTIDDLNFWRAYFDTVGTDEWWQAATITAEVANLRETVIAAISEKYKPDYKTPEDFMPIARQAKPKAKPSGDGSVARFEAFLAAQYGG